MKTNLLLLAFLFSSGVSFASVSSTANLPNNAQAQTQQAAIPFKRADKMFKTTSAVKSATININQVSAQELMQLKGIGARKAEAIIDYRNNHGQFQSIDELTHVKGISKRIIEENRGKLSV